MNKRALRLILAMVIGFLPLASKLPYVFRAWQISPLDRPGRVFAMLFLLTFAASWSLAWKRCQSWDARATPATILGGMVFLAGAIRDIHGVMIVGAIVLAWAIIWLAAGWRSAYVLLPSFIPLLMAAPSLRYWLGYFTGTLLWDGLTLMSIAAVIAIIWLLVTQILKYTPPCEVFCFSAVTMMLLGLIALMQGTKIQAKALPLIPDFSSLEIADFLGRELEPTPSDRIFFGDNEINKYYFASEQTGIIVLAVNCGDDVHQIHPASYCLRSSGWKIVSEKMLPLQINDQDFVVNEIVANQKSQTSILWAWYTNRQFSTSSFLLFRQSWRRFDAWQTYQLLAPLDDEPDAARQQLTKLLQQAMSNTIQ